MHNHLQAILKANHENNIQLKKMLKSNSAHELHEVTPRTSNKSFYRQLSKNHGNVIAEVKRASPSKGQLAEIKDPVKLAMHYANANASAISVLTSKAGFNGSLHDLTAISSALADQPTALLRKDFITDAIQIKESVLAGADAILLIVAVTQDKTEELLKLANTLNIDALVEVHTREELQYAISIDAKIIGVNNRNLTTFEVNPNNALSLIKYIPDHIVSIAESGMTNSQDANSYIHAGYNAVLMGEALVKSKTPEIIIQEVQQCMTPK